MLGHNFLWKCKTLAAPIDNEIIAWIFSFAHHKSDLYVDKNDLWFIRNIHFNKDLTVNSVKMCPVL